MTRYVVDTNVFIRRSIPPLLPSVVQFFADLTESDDILGPQMLLPECTSVFREQVHAKAIRDAIAREALETILATGIRTITLPEQFARSFELATRFQLRKAYDMQFVAVAEVTGATIVTGDRGMRHAAEAVGVPVRFLR